MPQIAQQDYIKVFLSGGLDANITNQEKKELIRHYEAGNIFDVILYDDSGGQGVNIGCFARIINAAKYIDDDTEDTVYVFCYYTYQTEVVQTIEANLSDLD